MERMWGLEKEVWDQVPVQNLTAWVTLGKRDNPLNLHYLSLLPKGAAISASGVGWENQKQ